jgi:hypothetical protein
MVFTTNLVKHLMDIQLWALLTNQALVKLKDRTASGPSECKIASQVSPWARVNSLL